VDEGDLLTRYGLSIALGLLIGAERERIVSGKAGLRTFALIALAGTLAAHLATLMAVAWFSALPLLAIVAALIVAYNAPPATDDDRGMTTVVAAVICYGIGVLTWWDQTELAVALGLATTALLYFKSELHGFSQNLSRQDVVSFMQFAAITFVVLPVLPDEPFGPFGALNPFRIWLMVVLVSGLSLAGYVALRVAGPRHGPLLVGALGGVASSTATTLAFARHAARAPEVGSAAAVVILVANLMVLVRIALVTTLLAPGFARGMVPVLASGLLLGLAYLVWYYRRRAADPAQPDIAMRNPAEVGVALGFGALFAGVLLASAWLNSVVGEFGVYGVALVSGLTDVDAITLSTLRLVDEQQLIAAAARTAILLALLSNLGFKLGLAFSIGGLRLGREVGAGFLAVALGLGAGWALL
jgi:uncharacterized membrane protein (DUF4010 family)